MTRLEKLKECRAAISDGKERVGESRDIWQNELIWWMCKAILLLLGREIKAEERSERILEHMKGE